MANTGVKGCIAYANMNTSVTGMEIHGRNNDPFEQRIHLGNSVKTDADRKSSITYNE